MEILHQILLALGRIEGELIEIRKLSQRVSMLEQCQAWLKGAFAGLMAAIAYLFRAIYAK
jgi:hypothetical protein